MTGTEENASADPQLDLVNVCLTVPGLTGGVTPPSSSPYPSHKSETAGNSSGCNHVPQKDTSPRNLERDCVWKRAVFIL